MRHILVLLLLGGACFAQAPPAPSIHPIFPPAVVVPSPTSAIPLTKGKYLGYDVKDYTGPLTWEIEDEAIVGFKEFPSAGQLFGVIEGKTEPEFADIAIGNVVVWGKAPGMAHLTAYGIVGGKPKRLVSVVFQVPGVLPPVPPPTPPVPPGPLPPVPPIPPAPEPAATITTPGLHVAFFFDRMTLGSLPAAQQEILTHPDLRNWLTTKCAKAGGYAEARWYDKGTDAKGDFPGWDGVCLRKRDSYPWMVIIKDGFIKYEGPVGPDTAAVLKTLQPFGG